MNVRELIERLGGFDPDANVYIQIDGRSYEPLVWIGISDTAGLFDEEKNFQLVISPWKSELYRRPRGDEPKRNGI